MIKIKYLPKLKLGRRGKQKKDDKKQLMQCLHSTSAYDHRAIAETFDEDKENTVAERTQKLTHEKKETNIDEKEASLELWEATTRKEDVGEASVSRSMETQCFRKNDSSLEDMPIEDVRMTFEASFCDLSAGFASNENVEANATAVATFQASFRGLDSQSLGSNEEVDVENLDRLDFESFDAVHVHDEEMVDRTLGDRSVDPIEHLSQSSDPIEEKKGTEVDDNKMDQSVTEVIIDTNAEATNDCNEKESRDEMIVVKVGGTEQTRSVSGVVIDTREADMQGRCETEIAETKQF
jgi:hypothetical protein